MVTVDKTREEKKEIRDEYLLNQLEEGSYVVPFEKKILYATRKLIFWFITNHVRFRSLFNRLDKNKNTICRLCEQVEETPEHLLFNCQFSSFNLDIGENFDISNFEK